jgi:hypothetical protein
VQISTLRKALGEGWIITVPGRGYRLSTTPPKSPASLGTPPQLPDKPSLVVLPFQDMSGDPEQHYFVDGLVQDITTALSCISALWINRFGKPLGYAAGYDIFQRMGKRILGWPINVHSVRYDMATTTLDNDSHDIEIASAGLAHRGTSSVARVYDKGGSKRANRTWQKILKRRRLRG